MAKSKKKNAVELSVDPREDEEIAQRKPKFEIPQWYFKCRLENGAEKCYRISTEDKDRLESMVLNATCREKEVSFFEFDSDTHHILMQFSQIMFCHFLFEPLGAFAPPQDSEDFYDVKIYFTDNPNPKIFQVDNEPYPEHEEGEMSNFIYDTLHAHEEGNMVYFMDIDGETAYFKPSSIALVETPLKLLDPDAFPDDDLEEDDEII